MNVNFYPESDEKELMDASMEYKEIWQESGQRIIESYKQTTGFAFIEKQINAVICEKPSYSHPLILRASYQTDVKKGTLVHELGHRLLVGNNVAPSVQGKDYSLNAHKQLFLVLFDVWRDLFGSEFAKKMVSVEKERGKIYEDAWDWALSFSKDMREQNFRELVITKDFTLIVKQS